MKRKKVNLKIGTNYLYIYLKPHAKEFVFMVVALLLSSSSVLLMSQCIRNIIDIGLTPDSSSRLASPLIYIMLLVLTLSIATAARVFFTFRISQKISADIRLSIYKKILELSASFFELSNVGKVLSLFVTDIALLQNVINSSLSIAMRNLVMLAGGITMLFITNYKLTLLIIIAIPIALFPVIMLGKRTRKLGQKIQENASELSSICEETINSIKTIQAYVREELELNKLSAKINQELNSSVNYISHRAIFTAFVILLAFSVISLVLWVGGKQVLSGELSPGNLFSFVFLSMLCASSTGAIVEAFSNLQKVGEIGVRVSDFLKTEVEIKNKADIAVELKFINTENSIFKTNDAIENRTLIKFNNVTFYYPSQSNNPALSNINIDIKLGQNVAILGKSGAGKSTIFELLLRFYEVKNGYITINNHNILDLRIDTLRSQFAYISQNPFIFSDSIIANIAYSRPEANFEEVREAAKAAEALEFIENLPQGFDTFVGQKGARLSGGQKQRLAIARAILKNSPIILLDEATSALDIDNEQKIFQSIKNTMADKTIIVIAHRLSTLMNVDNVIVLDAGKVLDQGRFNELITKDNECSKFLLSIQGNKK